VFVEVLEGGLAGFGVDDHGAELDHAELALAEAEALLDEEDGAGASELDRDGDGQHERRQNDQA